MPEASRVFHSRRQVWVHVAYTRYRHAYRKAFPEENVDGKALNHAMNRRVAALTALSPGPEQTYSSESCLSCEPPACAQLKNAPFIALYAKHFYRCQHEAILCTRLWRYVSQVSELKAIERDTKTDIAAEQKRLHSGAEQRRAEASRDKSDWGEDARYVHATHFALFRYLARDGWPAKFLVLQLTTGVECGRAFAPSYIVPPLAFDAAIIENSSPDPIRIRDFVGVIEKKGSLRLAEHGNSPLAAAVPLGMPSLLIPSHGKIILPLGISLFGGVVDVERWGSMSEAQRMYQRIASSPANAVFTITDRAGDGARAPINFHIKKRKASFMPPEIPESAEYRFGPQLFLSAFLLEKDALKFDQNEPNLVTLYGDRESSMPEPEPAHVEVRLHLNTNTVGSCPILYSWDDARGEWVYHGKVIHAANGQENEMTSVVNVGPAVRRFRLAEEEPEVASIRGAELLLSLSDGRRVVVKSPDLDQLGNGGSPRRISAYSKMDFNFSVPQEYVSTGIDRAELAVTGFYERYRAISAAKSVLPDRRKP
jgi:hypothetical protein